MARSHTEGDESKYHKSIPKDAKTRGRHEAKGWMEESSPTTATRLTFVFYTMQKPLRTRRFLPCFWDHSILSHGRWFQPNQTISAISSYTTIKWDLQINSGLGKNWIDFSPIFCVSWIPKFGKWLTKNTSLESRIQVECLVSVASPPGQVRKVNEAFNYLCWLPKQCHSKYSLFMRNGLCVQIEENLLLIKLLYVCS